jgi:hypothetical protein
VGWRYIRYNQQCEHGPSEVEGNEDGGMTGMDWVTYFLCVYVSGSAPTKGTTSVSGSIAVSVGVGMIKQLER